MQGGRKNSKMESKIIIITAKKRGEVWEEMICEITRMACGIETIVLLRGKKPWLETEIGRRFFREQIWGPAIWVNLALNLFTVWEPALWLKQAFDKFWTIRRVTFEGTECLLPEAMLWNRLGISLPRNPQNSFKESLGKWRGGKNPLRSVWVLLFLTPFKMTSIKIDYYHIWTGSVSILQSLFGLFFFFFERTFNKGEKRFVKRSREETRQLLHSNCFKLLWDYIGITK